MLTMNGTQDIYITAKSKSLNFTATHKCISNSKRNIFEKGQTIIKHKKSLILTKKWSIKTTSSLNIVDYKLKNIVIDIFGSC